MNQMDRAKLIGVSQGYLWRVYHGYAKPGKKVLPKLIKATGKNSKWWDKASISEVQKVLDAVGG